MVDYADLARKFGAKGVTGEVSFAPQTPTTDYGALAKQFGATGFTPSEPAPALPDEGIPTERRTWPEALAEGVTNIPSSAYKFGAETLSMLNPLNALDTLESVSRVGYGALRAGAEKVLPSSAFAYLASMEDPDAAAKAQQAAEVAGGHYARYFTEEGWKEAIATDPVGTVADLSMLMSGAGGGLRAAGRPALARPFELAGARLDPMQVPAAALTNIGVPLMTKGVEIANRFAAPKYYALQQALAGRERPVLNALRSPEATLVPGTQPTAGPVAAPSGSTGFAGLMRSEQKVLPDEFAEVERLNIAARQAALETAAGGPSGVAKARAEREGITAPMYAAAKKIKVPEDAALQELMSRPVISEVTRIARDIAKNKGEAFKIGETTPAQTVASTILDEFGRPVTREIPATMAEYSVRDLHNMKAAMDKLLTKGPREFGIDRIDMSAVRQARKEFVDWLDNKVPEYAAARAEYARLSKPVNQAEVLTYLKDTLKGLIEGRERGRAFIQAAGKDAPKTIQRAIDAAPRFEKLSDILEPDQIKLVMNIARDLEREERFADLAAWRGEMGPKAGKIAEEATLNIPQAITKYAAVLATRALKALQGKIGKDAAIEIALASLDPKAMAVMAGEALMAKRKTRAGIERNERVMKTTAEVMKTPKFLAAQRAYNAMVEEPKNAMARR
jgi:hypothetical protein